MPIVYRAPEVILGMEGDSEGEILTIRFYTQILEMYR